MRAVLMMDDIPLNLPAGGLSFDVNPVCLAIEEVSYVDEPVAIVLAESRHIAEDAAALGELGIEALHWPAICAAAPAIRAWWGGARRVSTPSVIQREPPWQPN
jgi:CO/xanthine dehydrogenase Mo-binding subunit